MRVRWPCLVLLSEPRFLPVHLRAGVLSPQVLALVMPHGLSGVRGGVFDSHGRDSKCAQQTHAVCDVAGCDLMMKETLGRLLSKSMIA